MITIKNVNTLDDQITDYQIPSTKDQTIEAQGKFLLLPAVIDPHICLGRMNGKENNWDSAVLDVIKGGITTIIEIPSQEIACDNQEQLEEKKSKVDHRLSELHLPLDDLFYANADLKEVERWGLLKKLVKGIVISFDPHKKEEVGKEWDRLFQMAAWQDLPIIVNAWNENRQGERTIWHPHKNLLDKAIDYSEKHNTRLYVLNVATQQEIDLIQQARKRSLLIYAETTPQHLFQEDSAKADVLWKALNDGVIETVGSGYHADHQNEEKVGFEGHHLSIQNPILLLPFLLTAYRAGKITIERLVRLVKFNIHDIFEIEKTGDVVLVDLKKEKVLQKQTEKGSSKMTLKGWPVYTIVKGHVVSCL